MPDPLSIAATAIGLLKNTSEALGTLRERSQRSKDLDIKEQINTLYDNVLQLKEVISRLLDENKDLRGQLEHQRHLPEEPRIRQVGETNYYFKSDEGPFCQPCYDGKSKALVALSPQRHSQFDNSITRECSLCRRTFYEKRGQEPEGQIVPSAW